MILRILYFLEFPVEATTIFTEGRTELQWSVNPTNRQFIHLS